MKESAQATPVNFILTAAVGLKFLKYWVQMFPAHATYVDAQGNTVAHLALGEMIGTKQIDFEAAITFVENLMMSNKNILKEKNSLGQTPIWIFRQNKLTKDVCLDKTVFEKHQKFCKALKTED